MRSSGATVRSSGVRSPFPLPGRRCLVGRCYPLVGLKTAAAEVSGIVQARHDRLLLLAAGELELDHDRVGFELEDGVLVAGGRADIRHVEMVFGVAESDRSVFESHLFGARLRAGGL